ncbi:MAG: PspC domain-containing protein, partial [Flavobacterium sp.]|nr:PspC domain-containing protein [Flavobacterium sp.]
MNKTVNINLGGMFFYIDEDAYQKMTRYFDAIKRSLNNSNGQDEIIKDIEMRIAELISEKHSNDKQVISIKELDEVIAVMGQPEDYRLDNDGEETKTNSFDNSTIRPVKKLYRDRETGLIGGVIAGLGHYFGIDKVWLRIIFLVLLFSYGIGFLTYIILWIVMPEAITTSEKLEMCGEPINISNIEKKVREEYQNVSEKIKNVDYDRMGNQVKSGADRIGSTFGDFILTLLKIFAKVIGVILVINGLTVLLFLLVGIFTLGTGAFIDFPWQHFVEAGNFTEYPIWVFGLLMFLAVGIPFFFLMILGFKLLIPTMKSTGNIAKYSLLAIWIIALIISISIGINQAIAFSVEGRVVKKEVLNLNPNDTLQIKFKHNSYFAQNINDRKDFMITPDSTGNEIIYSDDVDFKIQKTDEKVAYLEVIKQAKGKSLYESKKTAEKIKYNFSLVGNKLILDNFLITEVASKFRDQQVEIILYLPKGTLFKADESVRDYDNSDDEYFNLHYSSDTYLYKVEESKVKCLDCPDSEDEFNDVG